MMMQHTRYTNRFLDVELTADNAFAFRRCLRMEKKNRRPVQVRIEQEILDAAGVEPRSGELSDLVNQGLTLILIASGRL